MKFVSFLGLVLLLAACHSPAKQPTSTTVQDTIQKPDSMDAASTALLQIKEKLDQGIDFIASGQEPFWSLEIDFDKQLHFKTASGFEITTPVPEGVKAMDAVVTRYRAVTEQGELIAQLAQRACTNSMSGATAGYTVTVDVKSSTANDYTRYEGCGAYTVDYRINDIWVLEKINETILKPADFTKGLPQLEINLAQKKAFGHTGCNNLNGAAEVQGRRLAFGMFITTRMACPNMDFENKYVSSLQQRIIPYKVESMKLQLQISQDTVYTYRKVD